MALLLGIDLGTSYFKVGLFDVAGTLRGLGRVPVKTSAPAPNRCELAVDEFWCALRHGLNDALAQAGATPPEIVGVSYSSQASTFVLLDGNDVPLTPLIVWTDARGAPVPPKLAEFSGSDEFARRIGFTGLSPQSAAAKWAWFQQHDRTRWARARRIMTIADYFTFALTGERTGDASTVAFLALYDLLDKRWWPEALHAFGVEAEQLSVSLRPGSSCGRTVTRASELLGLPVGIPFAVGALDHHAAAIGSGLEALANLSISTGTVLAALALVDEPVPRAECFHGCHVDGARYWRLAFNPNGAGQLEAYQRQFAPQCSIEELLAMAGLAPAGIAWRGTTATQGDAVRAILERVAAMHRVLVRTVAGTGADENAVQRVVATGGGARSPLWLQINADMLGVPVVTPACAERACLGAATFAAVAAGFYPSIREATTVMVRPDRVYEPASDGVAVYRDAAR
jgi:xylulokinase